MSKTSQTRWACKVSALQKSEGPGLPVKPDKREVQLGPPLSHTRLLGTEAQLRAELAWLYPLQPGGQSARTRSPARVRTEQPRPTRGAVLTAVLVAWPVGSRLTLSLT